MNNKRPIISILVVSIDYKLNYHVDKVDNIIIPNPELRIFGSNSSGQRVCCHISGVLPYIYIRPSKLNHALFQKVDTVQSLLTKIRDTLETILNTKNIKNNKKRKHIHNLEIVKKKTIYGMHLDEFIFIKVYLYHPRDRLLIAEALEEISIVGVSMQSYESHIPYILQFTSDNNISPMGWLHLSEAKIRSGSHQIIFLDPSTVNNTSSIHKNDNHITSTTSPELCSMPLLSSDIESTLQQSNITFSDESSTKLEPPDILTQHQSQVYFSTSQSPVNSTVKRTGKQGNNLNNSTMEATISNQTNDSKFGLNVGIDKEEIDALLEGITAEHLVWTQPVQLIPNHYYLGTNKFELDEAVNQYNNKLSSCEVEIDTAVSSILNNTMPRQRFGLELWEEEKARCLAKGILFEEDPSPPSTQTVHRHIYQTELDFIKRFENLQRKGNAFRIECNRKIQTLESHEVSDCLSQFCRNEMFDGENDMQLKSSSLVDKETPHVPELYTGAQNKFSYIPDPEIDDWVNERINEAETQIHHELQLTNGFQNSLLFNEMKDNLKSNVIISPGILGNCFQNDNNIIDDNDDEKLTANEISQEMENILWSTQVNFENMHDIEANIASPAIAGVNSPLFEMQLLNTDTNNSSNNLNLLECSFTTRDELWKSFYSDCTPMKDVVLDTQTINKNTGSNSFSNIQFSNSNTSSQKSLSSVFRKRKIKNSPFKSIQFPVYEDHDTTDSKKLKSNISSSLSLNDVCHLTDEKVETKKTKRQVSFKGSGDEIFEYSPLKPAVSFLQSFICSTNDFSFDNGSHTQIIQPKINKTLFPINDADETFNLSSLKNISTDSSKSFETLAMVDPCISKPLEYENDSALLYLLPLFQPPHSKELTPLISFGIENITHQKLHYTDTKDVSNKIANQLSKANSYFLSVHPIKFSNDCLPFDGGFESVSNAGICKQLYLRKTRCLLPAFLPPSKLAIQTNDNFIHKDKFVQNSFKSQICTPTQTPHSVETASNGLIRVTNSASLKYMKRLIVLSTEVFCCTRSNLLPNPKFDGVQMIFWVADDCISNSESESKRRISGVICRLEYTKNSINKLDRSIFSSGLTSDCFFDIAENEVDLIEKFISRVRTIDPDFLLGYELTSNSIGYLNKRSKILGINLCQELSRMPKEEVYFQEKDDDEDQVHSDIRISGRIILNGWDIMKDEVKLFNYTYSNVAAHVLSIRVPLFTFSQLTRWFSNPKTLHRVMKHMFGLTQLNLDLIDKIDLLRRVSECARLYGIDFNSVLTRGSQYRVEAALLVKAHSKGYLLISPSKQSVASQAPMEVIPLVMEPRSCMYTDPIVVLDFQSLYPSMILSYNLCFSTCMGKLKTGTSGAIDTTEKLGVTSYPETDTALNIALQQQSTTTAPPYIAPNGSMFCHKDVRLGILPAMVEEMLSTRVMVKKAMKKHTKDGHNKILGKVLDARQLAIKLLSNVTYGYTAAGFSGRMPMSELADAIVQSGRSLLEWTISTINANVEWNSKVVYGDTDSVFIHLPGRSVQEAFLIGQQIAQYITGKSPANVVLKFEKVYYPSILVTKKRYVGYKFESIDQLLPNFEAKGIEVVRRDQCLATVKIQEKALRIIFETKDMSKVRQYLESEWNKMMQGGDKLLLKDFIFSKEVRFGRYSSLSSQPPGAIVATKAVLKDEMAVPPHNWRVPYVVVNGTISSALKNLVYSPEELLRRGTALRLNYVYYMTKCINPALDRVFSLCGADIFAWFKNVLRPKLRIRHLNYDNYYVNTTLNQTNSITTNGVTINKPILFKQQIQKSMDQFTIQGNCEICSQDAIPQTSLCKSCQIEQNTSLTILMQRLHIVTNKEKEISRICQNCSKFIQPSILYKKNEIIGPDACESLDCTLFYERSRLITRIEDCQLAISEIEDKTY